jgi:hypothetical protein
VARVYGEPIGVSMRSGKPARFVWRDRLHTVLAVLDRWVTTREWLAEQGGEPDASADREFWLVEASPGRNVPSRAYELRRDTGTGQWLLSRVWD